MSLISINRLTRLTIPLEASKKLAQRYARFKRSPYHLNEFDKVGQLSEKILKETLPPSFFTILPGLRRGTVPFIEIVNVPEEPNLPLTPSQNVNIEKEKKTYVKEYFSLGLARAFGLEIFNYRQEAWGTGHPIFNIFPVQKFSSLKGAGGFEPDFRMHSENAWHPRAVEMLFLTGLRPDPAGEAITYCTANEDILKNLSPDEVKVLQEMFFEVFPPEIHRLMELNHGIVFAEDQNYSGPVLTFSEEGTPYFRVNFNGMKPLVESAKAATAALSRLENLATSMATEVRLGSKNMLVINNKASLHTRNGYKPRFDGNDRWFQRYFLTNATTLWQKISLSKHHVDFLGTDELSTLVAYLQKHKIIDGNRHLTSNFKPHERAYEVPLPDELRHLKKKITKALLKIGPAKPHRII